MPAGPAAVERCGPMPAECVTARRTWTRPPAMPLPVVARAAVVSVVAAVPVMTILVAIAVSDLDRAETRCGEGVPARFRAVVAVECTIVPVRTPVEERVVEGIGGRSVREQRERGRGAERDPAGDANETKWGMDRTRLAHDGTSGAGNALRGWTRQPAEDSPATRGAAAADRRDERVTGITPARFPARAERTYGFESPISTSPRCRR